MIKSLRDKLADSAGTPGLRVCIHRGAHQIGGTCIELECQGLRIVLDVGVPLDADDPATVEMPDVTGLNTDDPSLLGIVISHPHQDHYGLASRVPAGTPFLMGAATERILSAAADFTLDFGTFANLGEVAVGDGGAILPFYNDSYNLTVIPEPGTALLMGLGLAGLATQRRR